MGREESKRVCEEQWLFRNQQGSPPSGLKPSQALVPLQAEEGAKMGSVKEMGAECADFPFLCLVHSHDSTPDKSVGLTVTKR